MPIVLKGLQDTAFFISIPKDNQNEFDVSVLFGDPSLPISNPDMTFPFSSGRAYKIIQGNNSNPSHNYPGSRYAVDFSLQINDTICAAADGYVVAMVEGYEHGGPLKKWRPYSNYIFIYNAESNLFFNYGHLVKDGSFVALGDTIKMGQPIGLAGLTGYTTVEHLHFDVKKAVDESPGVISTIHTYIDGTKSTKLKRGMRVSRK
jgi:murein DD-endopeptidase MepM/ murein hydrolase activator NlpD